jgi:hypothetical protein
MAKRNTTTNRGFGFARDGLANHCFNPRNPRFQTVKKSFKNREKKLASHWPLPLDRKAERQTALFGRSKKV